MLALECLGIDLTFLHDFVVVRRIAFIVTAQWASAVAASRDLSCSPRRITCTALRPGPMASDGLSTSHELQRQPWSHC